MNQDRFFADGFDEKFALIENFVAGELAPHNLHSFHHRNRAEEMKTQNPFRVSGLPQPAC